MENKIWVCVYAEDGKHDLCYVLIPEHIVRAYYDGDDFDTWYHDEYTADETIDLLEYARQNYGFIPSEEDIEWFM